MSKGDCHAKIGLYYFVNTMLHDEYFGMRRNSCRGAGNTPARAIAGTNSGARS